MLYYNLDPLGPQRDHKRRGPRCRRKVGDSVGTASWRDVEDFGVCVGSGFRVYGLRVLGFRALGF